ncbi:MAG TPA: ABC transporter permease [Gaiellaceae bacterium]|nr:ABC transporter permease [Gaiellaceae bacterium]
MSAVAAPQRRRTLVRTELAKYPAFFRRDLLVALSYRAAFASDWANLVFQAALFYLVGRMVDPARLPVYGGSRATYMEFVAVGIALSAFVTLGLLRVSAGIRQEQLTGTLESILVTPTTPATVQLGSVAYDLAYIPIRTLLFLLVVGSVFGLHFKASGVVPAIVLLLAFIPFVWGLGTVGAAAALTVRRGTVVTTYLITALTVGSSAYFPEASLPAWFRPLVSANPMTTALDGMRQALLGHLSGGALARDVGILAAASAVALAAGVVSFRLALARERRRGTLGQY